jgi:hypothetical protein
VLCYFSMLGLLMGRAASSGMLHRSWYVLVTMFALVVSGGCRKYFDVGCAPMTDRSALSKLLRMDIRVQDDDPVPGLLVYAATILARTWRWQYNSRSF